MPVVTGLAATRGSCASGARRCNGSARTSAGVRWSASGSANGAGNGVSPGPRRVTGRGGAVGWNGAAIYSRHIDPVWSENSSYRFFSAISGLRASPRIETVRSAGLRSMHLGRSFRIEPSELRVPNFCPCTAIALRWPAHSPPATIGIRPEFNSSGSGAVIVVQHAAQPLAALDLTGVAEMARLWTDELVRQASVVAFTVIVGDDVLNGCPQRLLPEEDHTFKTSSPTIT